MHYLDRPRGAWSVGAAGRRCGARHACLPRTRRADHPTGTEAPSAPATGRPASARNCRRWWLGRCQNAARGGGRGGFAGRAGLARTGRRRIWLHRRCNALSRSGGGSAMTILLDHVSHYVHDRDVAAGTLRGLGLNATPGGRHPGVGSANNLCYFDLFYIEMLAIVDREEALGGASGICRQAVAFLENGEGFGNVAFETEALDEAVAAMRAHGLQVDDPVRMERVQPDGFVSVSRIAYPTSGTPTAIPLPILIERSLRPAERAPMLRAKGVIAEHAAGAMEVDHIGLCTRDLDAALDVLRRFGLDGAVIRFEDPALNASCVRGQTGRGGGGRSAPPGAGPGAGAPGRPGGGPPPPA